MGGALTSVGLWLLRSPDGTAWLLARLPGLDIKGAEGALLSDAFAAERIVVRWDLGRQSVSIDGLRTRGLRWTWHPAQGAWVGLSADLMQARRVEVQTGPTSARPMQMPRTLQLPSRLQAAQVEIAELQIDTLPPMHAVQGRGIRLWEPGGREYHADALAFDWDRAHIEGSASMGAYPPFTLQAQARLAARTEPGLVPAWTADARATGPLARLDVQAMLHGAARRGGPAPHRRSTSTRSSRRWKPGRSVGCVCIRARSTFRRC